MKENEINRLRELIKKIPDDDGLGITIGGLVGEIITQNKRYREYLEYMLEEAKDHKRKGLRIQHWALIKDLEAALERLG